MIMKKWLYFKEMKLAEKKAEQEMEVKRLEESKMQAFLALSDREKVCSIVLINMHQLGVRYIYSLYIVLMLTWSKTNETSCTKLL